MLNTLPPNSVRAPQSPVPLPPRRRGAQPTNRNALRHGLFARHNSTPLAQFVNTIQVSTKGLDRIPEILSQAIPAIRDQIARQFASLPQAADLRSILAWHRPILRLLGLLMRVEKTLARHREPLLQLHLVAEHALDLIRYDFRENGITRDAYSFREKK